MKLQSFGGGSNLIPGHLLHSGNILSRGQGHTAEGHGAVIVFDGAGGIVGGFELADNGLLGIVQLPVGDLSIPAKLQLLLDGIHHCILNISNRVIRRTDSRFFL